MVYLDYNATSPVRDTVKKAVFDIIDDYGNASSVHSVGRKARSVIENSRDIIADYLGILPQNIIFTSTATEANHLFIRGIECDAVITSCAEHDSVLRAIEKTKAFDSKGIFYIEHHKDGTLSQESFDNIVLEVQKKYKKPLLTLMKVNNETGVIQDLSYFSQKMREIGGYIHSDCVQAVGKIEFDNWLWQCDAITLTGHKVGGLKGAGVLIVKENIELSPLLTGGGQEMRRRAGTENMLDIHALGVLFKTILNKDFINQEIHHLQRLRQFIETEIMMINPNAIIVAQNNTRVSNTICVISEGLEAEKQVIIADLQKICLSSGSACSSGKVKSSHVLNAYGYSVSQAMSAIRISTGFLSTHQDCEAFLKAYQVITNKILKL